jgi:Type II secretion system (T2SS), protein N
VERLAKNLFFTLLIVYTLGTIVVRVPADWGAWGAVKFLPNLSLAGVTGSIWSGRAASAQARIGNEIIDLGELKWGVNVLPFFTLKTCVDIDSRTLRGNYCRDIVGKNIVRQLTIEQMPIKLVGNMLGVQLGGSGNLLVQEGEFQDNGQIELLKGNLTWQHGRVNVGTGWFALGSFAADLKHIDGGGIGAQITDIEGDFTVQLDGQYVQGQPPRVNGIIKPKETAQQPLIDALSVFAETLDDGSFRITWPMGG